MKCSKAQPVSHALDKQQLVYFPCSCCLSTSIGKSQLKFKNVHCLDKEDMEDTYIHTYTDTYIQTHTPARTTEYSSHKK